MGKKKRNTYQIGLSKPIIAKYNYNAETKAITYSDAFRCGEAMTATITPNYVTGQLYGDDKLVEEASEFTNASIQMGTTTMPAQAPSILFGHSVDAETGEETSGANDSANYVGQGFAIRNSDGSYNALVIVKAKYTEGAENFQTKGSSLNYVTPSLAGTAFTRDTDDVWRIKSFGFASEHEAVEWICSKMGIENTFTTDGSSGSKEPDGAE